MAEENKRIKLQTTYVGAIYFTNLVGNSPVMLLKVTEEEMERGDWLVEMLVRLFPNQKNFGWNGCHVMLTTRNDFPLNEYNPSEMWGGEDMMEFSCEDIYELFQAHPKWKNLEKEECV